MPLIVPVIIHAIIGSEEIIDAMDPPRRVRTGWKSSTTACETAS
jgi:hypothetical protein